MDQFSWRWGEEVEYYRVTLYFSRFKGLTALLAWCFKYPHIPGKFDTKRGGINGVFFSALWQRKS